MTDRPIIFSAPMVRALLAERKTQTRRVLKPHPEYIESSGRWKWSLPPKTRRNVTGGSVVTGSREFWEYAPNGSFPYAVGDLLWVRENCATWGDHEAIYRADDAVEYGLAVSDGKFGAKWKARPSIHMPRWASRLTLTVTDVRVQRLQDISELDAKAEGLETEPSPLGISTYYCFGDIAYSHAKPAYRDLWNSLHGPGAWDANPWVVALTFTVQRGNIDQMPGVAG